MNIYSLIISYIQFYLFLKYSIVTGYNISPVPNIRIKEPDDINFVRSKSRSAYFGYSILLRHKT